MIEAMKQALEALYPISHNSTDDYRGQADKAITSLRQAIAELESQEPVAVVDGDAHNIKVRLLIGGINLEPDTKLYTHPPQRTEQEPVAWATREDFYRELDRSVNRMRQQMEIKGVVMRCADYDVALPIIDIREGHVLVGQVTSPPQRQSLSDAVQVTIADFVAAVEGKEDFVGRPVYWAQWPNEAELHKGEA